jgi:hypothetical protein
MVTQRDRQTPKVRKEIHHYWSQYSAHLSTHPNHLVVNLMASSDNNRPNDLTSRFLVLTVVFVVLGFKV